MDHARDEAAHAASAGETVAAIGGDGLLRPIAAALAGTDSALAIIPGGRGNDFARVLGIPTEPDGGGTAGRGGRGQAASTWRRSTARPYLGIASFGFDSDANRIANEAQGDPRKPRVPVRRAARAGGVEAGRLHRDRRRRAPRADRLLGGGRELEGLRRRHVPGPPGRARRRPAGRRGHGDSVEARVPAQAPQGLQGSAPRRAQRARAARQRDRGRRRPHLRDLRRRRPDRHHARHGHGRARAACG